MAVDGEEMGRRRCEVCDAADRWHRHERARVAKHKGLPIRRESGEERAAAANVNKPCGGVRGGDDARGGLRIGALRARVEDRR